MLIVGLTGNFGMGKSFVLSLFRELGAVTLDSDRIVGILLKEEEVVRKVCEILGNDVLSPDGKLDKAAVAGKIFHDSELKGRLESLVHPLVFGRVNDFISKMKDRNRIVIVEVPLLFEGNYQGQFRHVITVSTSGEIAIGRLGSSGISRDEALARLKNQLPIETKKSRSDYVIDNSGTKEETKRQVEEVYRLLRAEMEKLKR